MTRRMTNQETTSILGVTAAVMEAKLMNGKSAISRRSTRFFVEDQGCGEMGLMGQVATESRHGSSDEKDNKSLPIYTTSSNLSNYGSSGMMIPMVDLGKDLRGLFASTIEDMGNQVITSLEAAKTSNKAKVDGRPMNFGVILPNIIYRSSFPMVEDFQFLATLKLKTIISLVKKDFSPGFAIFMKAHSIRHIIIEMQGTKKAAIPDAVMHRIMEVALDKQNHPLLIHCNHGKHRTGCAAAVIRHVAGWNIDSIIEEYKCYAHPKIRDIDIRYITEYQVAKLEGLFTKASGRGAQQCFPVLTSPKMIRFIILSALILCIWLAMGLFWKR